jgi:DNA topoisomerase-2
LKHQFFEGQQIEPMFYVPSLPILLVNGSEGVSSGFAQKILPRNPEDIKKYIKDKIQGKNSKVTLIPFYNGFKGTIEQGENSTQWLIKGVMKVTGINKVEISEVPIGYDLKSYIDVLDKLEDDKVIQGYRDKSENDNFSFEVTVPSKFLKEWPQEELMNKLKLIKKVSENYTCIDENNKIVVYESIQEIIDHYIEVKLKSLESRKEHLKAKLEDEIRYDYSKYLFIKMIVENSLVVAKRKKDEIIKDLDKVQDILTKDDSYDYLLNMNILSLTEERMTKLESDIKTKKADLDALIKKSIQQLWTEEI